MNGRYPFYGRIVLPRVYGPDSRVAANSELEKPRERIKTISGYLHFPVTWSGLPGEERRRSRARCGRDTARSGGIIAGAAAPQTIKPENKVKIQFRGNLPEKKGKCDCEKQEKMKKLPREPVRTSRFADIRAAGWSPWRVPPRSRRSDPRPFNIPPESFPCVRKLPPPFFSNFHASFFYSPRKLLFFLKKIFRDESFPTAPEGL